MNLYCVLRHCCLTQYSLTLVDCNLVWRVGLQRITDFEWVSRLRYYWRNNEMYVDMVQVREAYS